MAILHTREQGLRVHGLANLGGLVAIAGLEETEPPLLLGLLLELADRLPAITPERRAALMERGRQQLHERNAEKRAWKAFQKARDLHRVDLTTDQLRALLRALGAPIPDSKEELVAALSQGLVDREPAANRREDRER
jgi:hypothetical protein